MLKIERPFLGWELGFNQEEEEGMLLILRLKPEPDDDFFSDFDAMTLYGSDSRCVDIID